MCDRANRACVAIAHSSHNSPVNCNGAERTVTTMSYLSPIKNLPGILSQPTGLAILASLGVHGVIGFILPVLPIDSKSVNPSPKPVGLVQLTPAEQSRLPQASTPPVTLPDFANQPSALGKLPPAPSYKVSPPPTGTFAYKYPVTSGFPTRQSVRGTSPAPNTRSNQQQVAVRQQPPLSFDSRVKFKPGAPLPRNLPYLDAAVLPLLPPAPPPMSPEYNPNPLPQPTTNQTTTGEPQFRPVPIDTGIETARVNPPIGQPTSPVIPDNYDRRKQVLVARLRQSVESENNSTSSEAGRLAAAQLNAWQQWNSKVRGEHGDDVKTTAPISQTITDQSGLEGRAVVGVVVNSEGRIVSAPALIDKSGSAGIEQAALNLVRNYGFRATGKTTMYQFNLKFKPEGSTSSSVRSRLRSPARNQKPAVDADSSQRSPARNQKPAVDADSSQRSPARNQKPEAVGETTTNQRPSRTETTSLRQRLRSRTDSNERPSRTETTTNQRPSRTETTTNQRPSRTETTSLRQRLRSHKEANQQPSGDQAQPSPEGSNNQSP